MKRLKWSKKEDALVARLIAECGDALDWNSVAERVREHGYNRCTKQIKSRWMNSLVPHINKEKWSAESAERLFEVYAQRGNHWRDIAQEFAGRTDNSIKNQFFSLIRKALRSMAKTTGLDAVVSSTKIVNRIKPKILTDFLRKRIVLRGGGADGRDMELCAIEVVKELAFNKSSTLRTLTAAVRKSVFEILLKILFEINSDYETLSKMARSQYSAVVLNRKANVYVVELNASTAIEECANVLIVGPDADPYKEPLAVGFGNVEGEDAARESVGDALTTLKRTLVASRLTKEPQGDADSVKQDLINMLAAVQNVGETLQAELRSGGCGNAAVSEVAAFLRRLRVMAPRKQIRLVSLTALDNPNILMVRNRTPAPIRQLNFPNLSSEDIKLDLKKRNSSGNFTTVSNKLDPIHKFDTANNYVYRNPHFLSPKPTSLETHAPTAATKLFSIKTNFKATFNMTEDGFIGKL